MLPKLAFVFPGQGSQQVGLLHSLAKTFPLIREVFQEASQILEYDLWTLAQQGPDEVLNQTVHTQPILLTAGIALWRLWKTQTDRLPHFLLGHSLGEYTAYTCANSFSFQDAVQITQARGHSMQAAMEGTLGAMAAIFGLDVDQMHHICHEASQTDYVALANYNTLKQFVISGHDVAVERAMLLAKQQGAKLARKIPVSVAAHCTLMKPAAKVLYNKLAKINCHMPKIPVVNNYNARLAVSCEDIKDKLIQQVYQPVHWLDSIQYLLQEGVTHFIECGPGRVLSRLIQQIAPNIYVKVASLGDETGFQKALAL